jgi:hypothetical protein
MHYNKERKELFQKIPNRFSINEKVSIWVQRHENKYFINCLDINIDTEIENDQYIKPVTFVNNKNLKSWLTRYIYNIK